jgi:fatty-acyl-CoA synthase
MTETSSVVTLNTQTAEEKGLSMDDYCDHMSLQGPPLWGVDLKVVNEEGQELPRDSGSVGELKVRGHWVCESYYNRQDTAVDEGGWLATGDVGMITPEGSLQLTDRLKDLIKSGGEWISSAQLEDIALEHPLIEMASAIAVEHPKWDERPLLVVKTVEGNHLSVQEIRDSFVGKLAKWAIPDDVVFVSEFPLGATGKIHKLSLKQRFRDHFLQ